MTHFVNKIYDSLDQAFCYGLTKTSYQQLHAAYTLFQAACIHVETTNFYCAQQALKIQALFNVLDCGWTIFSVKILAEGLKKNYHVVFLGSYFNIAKNVGIVIAVEIVLFTIVQIGNRVFQQRAVNSFLKDIDEKKPTSRTIQFTRPNSHLLSHYLLANRIALSILFACISSSDRPLALVSLLGELYSLAKLTQLKWLSVFEKIHFPELSVFEKIHFPEGQWLKVVEVSYNLLLIPFVSATDETKCPICKEIPTYYFCSRHPMDNTCILKLINRKFPYFDPWTKDISGPLVSQEEMPQSWQLYPLDKRPTYTSHTTTDTYGLSRETVFVRLHEDVLPQCELKCEERFPPHAFFSVDVITKDGKKISAGVNVKYETFKPLPFFPYFTEAANQIYNLFQAGLVQTALYHLELAAHTIPIQRMFLVIDLICLVRDYTELYAYAERINQQKQAQESREQALEKQFVYSFSQVACILIPSLSAAVGVYLLQKYLQPSLDLKELLKGVLSPKELATVKLSWQSPLFHRVAQYITLSRIFVNLFSIGMATKVRNRIFHFSTFLFQSFVLRKISQLPWICMQKTFLRSEGGQIWSTQGYQQNLSMLTLNVNFLPSGTQELSSDLCSIYEYVAKFFKNCGSWGARLLIRLINGIETSRELIYEVPIQPGPPQGNPPPYVNSQWAIAWDDRHHCYPSINLNVVAHGVSESRGYDK